MKNALPPELEAEWDYSRNPEPSSSKVTLSDPVWWKGSNCGHSWVATTSKRKMGRGCTVCSGHTLLVGFNDLATKHPELAEMWHPTKNGDLLPTDIQAKHKNLVWWQCKAGHEWEASPFNRARKFIYCRYCSGARAYEGESDLATTHPELAKSWNSKLNNKSPEAYKSGSNAEVWWNCLDFPAHKTWKTRIYDRALYGTGCPSCSYRVSKPESSLLDFLRGVLGDVEIQTALRIIPSFQSNRKLELDIYIPHLKIGIEFNGLYWHSAKMRTDPFYHAYKRTGAELLGIKLITVWEDDWKYKQEIVKSMLKSKLHIDDRERVPARKLKIREITYLESSKFLEKTHIQGKSSGSLYIGGFYKDELVLVTVLIKRTSEEYELSRYATVKHVIGGHSKIVTWIAKNSNIMRLVTFADLDLSDGNLYEKTGWETTKILDPDYKYLNGDKREHKFNFRINRFKTDPNLKYEEGKTERELAEMNNLHRVWDSGKKKYEIDLTQFRK